MFDAATITFLSDLAANNNREWFAGQRARHEAHVAAPARVFCDRLSAELERRVGGRVQPKLYRIHRDVRFSKDKTPYNTHIHMGFSGAGQSFAWMVGIEPAGLVLGYGALGFDPAQLERWRAVVAGLAGRALADELARLGASGHRLDPPDLRRVPAPFAPDHPQGELLRRKSLVVWNESLPLDSAFGDAAPARLAESLAEFDGLRDWFCANF